MQLAFAASILLGYGAAYAAEAFAWLGMDGHIPEQARQEADRRVQGLIDWQALPLCSSFTLQVRPCQNDGACLATAGAFEHFSNEAARQDLSPS